MNFNIYIIYITLCTCFDARSHAQNNGGNEQKYRICHMCAFIYTYIFEICGAALQFDIVICTNYIVIIIIIIIIVFFFQIKKIICVKMLMLVEMCTHEWQKVQFRKRERKSSKYQVKLPNKYEIYTHILYI